MKTSVDVDGVLSDLVTFKTGKLNSNAAVTNGPYPFFTCSQEIYRTDTYSFDTECVLLGGNNASANYPIFYFKGKFDAYQRTYVIEPKAGVNIRYVYYLLKEKLKTLKTQSTGATTKFLTISILNNLVVKYPDFTEQCKIASIVGNYDDLIEKNERRIKILETMAQSLYEEWFVKFKFPGHENARMIDSGTELGIMPEGWKIGQLKDLVSNTKINPKTLDNFVQRIYVPIDCIDSQDLLLRRHESSNNAKSSLILFEKGDILFGAMRPYFHKVAITYISGITRSTCLVLRPKKYLMLSAFTLFYEKTISYATNHSQGSTIPYVSWENNLDKMGCVIPVPEIAQLFESKVTSILNLANKLVGQNMVANKARDTLITKLIK